MLFLNYFMNKLIISNIIFIIKHRTQGDANKLSALSKIRYIEKEWSSIPLCPACRIPSKTPPVLQKISTEDLLIESLFRKLNSNSFDEILSQFRELLKDIIKSTDSVESTENTKLWIAFGHWLGFKNPITKRNV